MARRGPIFSDLRYSSDRRFGHRVEKVQTFGPHRKRNLVTNRETGLRVDARDGHSCITDARFKDDFRTQLLNHFDTGVEAVYHVTEREMLRADAHKYVFAS